ncbi:hypothetical protein HDU83_009813 [Entophlyctis luteolus]|nr:hypothetical protein HDU83_009813 [Entophlyctis luteolus]
MIRYHDSSSAGGRDGPDGRSMRLDPRVTLPRHPPCDHMSQPKRGTSSESWYGFVRDHACAVTLAQAAAADAVGESSGVRVLRGPVRKLDIRSGTVLVLPNSSSLSRWRDGLSWSASKKVGGFLLYRQVQPSGVDNRQVVERSNLFHTGSLRANTTLIPNGLAKRTIVVTATGSPGMSSTGFKIINYFYPEQVEHHYDPKVELRGDFLRCASEALELRDYWADVGVFRVVLGNPNIRNQSPENGSLLAFGGLTHRENPPSVCPCGGLNGRTHVDELSRLARNPFWMEGPQQIPTPNMYKYY